MEKNTMGHLTNWSIQFYEEAKPINKWTGYSTYRDALRTISDMDFAIPLNWTYEIMLEESVDA
jgi:hypothetical protein